MARLTTAVRRQARAREQGSVEGPHRAAYLATAVRLRAVEEETLVRERGRVEVAILQAEEFLRAGAEETAPVRPGSETAFSP